LKSPENIRLLQQAIACFDDEQAYRQLFILFQPSLLQFAISMTKSKELSEEIVSDVFIKIWQKRHQLDKIENLTYYLFTAVKNQALNELQKQRKNLSLALDEVNVQFRSLYYDPEQKLISTEMIRSIQAAISQLPPRCQLIFKLIKENGLKYKEVAELLHLSVKTIENQMTLAIKKIGASIGNESKLDSRQLVDFLSKN
jgi:RNA polymerase sigma-70 factor (ECF subfamily)